MSVAEIKADAYKIFERIGENDLVFWSMVKAMAEQYVETKKDTKIHSSKHTLPNE